MITKRFQANKLGDAAALLRAGELVAFPTETVFGLGAIANNDAAVQNVYRVKGRPSDNPLIVHIHRNDEWQDYIADVPDERRQLIQQASERLWPGPLTMIVPVKPGIFSKTATGGLDTVGLRMPDHPLTLELIEKTGFPLVGPSANRSGKPSPTTVEHVLHDFDGKIAGVVDSEPTRIGVESTVVDFSDPTGIYILRPGFYTKQRLEAAVPGLVIDPYRPSDADKKQAPKAPGMKYRHYSPDLEVIAADAAHFKATLAATDAERTVAIALDQTLQNLPETARTYSLGATPADATHRLFAALRAYDDDPMTDALVVELLPNVEGNQAYRNRLLKASSRVVEQDE